MGGKHWLGDVGPVICVPPRAVQLRRDCRSLAHCLACPCPWCVVQMSHSFPCVLPCNPHIPHRTLQAVPHPRAAGSLHTHTAQQDGVVRPALLCSVCCLFIWSARTSPGLCGQEKFGFNRRPRNGLSPSAVGGTRVEQASYPECCWGPSASMDQAAGEQMVPGQGSRTAEPMGGWPGEGHRRPRALS